MPSNYCLKFGTFIFSTLCKSFKRLYKCNIQIIGLYVIKCIGNSKSATLRFFGRSSHAKGGSASGMTSEWHAEDVILNVAKRNEESNLMHRNFKVFDTVGWHGQTLFVRVFSILQRFSRTNEFVHATTQVSKKSLWRLAFRRDSDLTWSYRNFLFKPL